MVYVPFEGCQRIWVNEEAYKRAYKKFEKKHQGMDSQKINELWVVNLTGQNFSNKFKNKKKLRHRRNRGARKDKPRPKSAMHRRLKF